MQEVVKMDQFGRITIPKKIREYLNWKSGDELLITLTEDGNILLELLNSEERVV